MAGSTARWQREYRARRVAQFGGEANYAAWLEQWRASRTRLAMARACSERAFDLLVKLATAPTSEHEAASVTHHPV